MDKDLFLFIQSKMPPTVKTFDWWNNQFETEDEEDPFQVPAVFMEVQPYQTISEGKHRQYANITFSLHIGQHLYDRTNKRAKRQSQAMQHFDLCDAIAAALIGVGNHVNIGSITRTGVTPNHNYNGYIVHIHSYTCRVSTDIAVRAATALPPNTPLVIEP